MPQEIAIKNLIFVDCEGHGPAPTLNDSVSFEFGAVTYPLEIPRIVSDEQHKKGLLQARKNLMFAKRCTKQTYLLQGLIRCGKDHLKYRGHQEKSVVIKRPLLKNEFSLK